MKYKFLAILAGFLLTITGLSSPAQAGHHSGTPVPPGYAINLETGKAEKASAAAMLVCQSAAMCLYDSTTGTGLLEIERVSERAKSVCYLLQAANRNRVGYILNSSSNYWYVSAAGNCSAPLGTIYPNSRGAMNTDWNNVIDSFYRAT